MRAGRSWGLALACMVAFGAVTGCAGGGHHDSAARRGDGGTERATADGGADGGTSGPGLHVVSTQTWDLCRLVAPANQVPGVYGTDLGFSFSQPLGASDAKLVLLFGDTLRTSDSVCDYPPSGQDDLQGTLPGTRPASLAPGPPTDAARTVCSTLTLPPPDGTDSSPRRIRLFDGPGDRTTAHLLDTGPGRTPVGGFSDGTHAFAIFSRGEMKHCDQDAECPSGLVCTSDASYAGKPLGECSPPFLTGGDPQPVICRLDVGGRGDCGAYRTCQVPPHGVCVARNPFELTTPKGVWSPTWYENDARFSAAQTLYVASAYADRPEDYAAGYRFVTNKFVNPAVRTVAHFDPKDPERNDYRPGTQTLLMWGRPAFFARGGFQALPFLLYQPLEGLLGADGQIHWDPRYFAGYDPAGNPVWSSSEGDAKPVYGTDVSFDADGGEPALTHPEFDWINQTNVTWVAPLRRWVMLYGGDLPKFFSFDPATNQELPITHEEPVSGAIHFRVASHPWGRARADSPADEAWTDPTPLLTREQAAPYLACDTTPPLLAGCTQDHDPHRPLNLILTIDVHTSIAPIDYPTVTSECLNGDPTRNLQYSLSGDETGHLYSPDVLDPWTEDVTTSLDGGAPGDRAVEIYFHVATWNPYQVILYKTRFTAR